MVFNPMFRKIVYFLIAVVIVALLGWLGTSFFSNGGDGEKSIGPEEQLSPADLPSTEKLVRGVLGEKIALGTSDGIVEVRDFYKDPAVFAIEEEDFMLDIRANYYIAYHRLQSSFEIVIKQSPVESARANAELWLVDYLGITQEDACKLKALVTVPITVDQNLGGRSYPLSFCK